MTAKDLVHALVAWWCEDLAHHNNNSNASALLVHAYTVAWGVTEAVAMERLGELIEDGLAAQAG